MQSITDRRNYAPVSVHVNGESNNSQNSRRSRRNHNYTPIPLRVPFLTVIFLLFACSIGLIEILLHSSHTVTNAQERRSIIQPVASTHGRPLRPRKFSSPRSYVTKLAERSSGNCDNYDALPEILDSLGSARASMCADFAVTFEPYTANLSYPLMTAASEWLLDFNTVTSSSKYAYLSSINCEFERGLWTINPEKGSYTVPVPIGCSTTSAVFGDDGCSAYATIEIENLVLTSYLNEAVCPVSQAPLEITTDTSTNTISGGTPDNSLIDLGAVPGTEPGTTITLPNNPPSGPATPAPTVPTITLPAETAQATPQQVANPTNPVVQATATPQVQTIVTNLENLNSVAQVVTDMAGNVNTLVPIVQSVTYTYVDANGVAQTGVSTVGNVAGTVIQVTTTDSAGVVATLAVVVAEAQSTYITTNAQGQVQTLVAAYGVATGSATYLTTNSKGDVLTVTSGFDVLAVSQSRWTTTTQYTSLVTTTGTDGKPTSFLALVVETVTLSTSPDAQTATKTKGQAQSTTTGSSQPTFVVLATEKVVNGKVTITKYAAAMYLPALMAILIKVLWEMVLASVKLVQPFERMVKGHGANAQYVLFAQYLSSSLSLDMFKSLGSGNFIPLWVTLLYYLVQLGAPLAAASMTVKARNTCIVNNKDTPCDPVWVIDIWMLRGVEVVLVVCCFLTALVTYSMKTSQTGISSDPSSLASVAKLLNHEPLLDYIQQIDPQSDRQAYEEAFERHQFCLGTHRGNSGENLYGIIGFTAKNARLSEEELTSTAYDTSRLRATHSYDSIKNQNKTSNSFGRSAILTRLRRALVWDIIGVLLPLTLFAIVLGFTLDYNYDDALNRFMNSNSMAPRLLLMSMATGSAMHLAHLERCVRITEPFRRLAMGPPTTRSTSSVPETSLLLTRCGTSYSNLPYLLRLLQFEHRGGRVSFQILVTITTIFADVNVLAASGVAYNSANTLALYRFSTYATIAISGWIVLFYILMMFWWRRLPVIRLLSGEGISKGVGTIGGTARWLCSGGIDVLEAIAQSGGQWQHSQTGKKGYGMYQRDESESLQSGKVWFAHIRSSTSAREGRWQFEALLPGGSKGMRERHYLPPELAPQR